MLMFDKVNYFADITTVLYIKSYKNTKIKNSIFDSKIIWCVLSLELSRRDSSNEG